MSRTNVSGGGCGRSGSSRLGRLAEELMPFATSSEPASTLARRRASASSVEVTAFSVALICLASAVLGRYGVLHHEQEWLLGVDRGACSAEGPEGLLARLKFGLCDEVD